ncbi:MAG TPA: TerB family tellurite resistance protein [Rubricoccaceae bacterium]|nr:TerB family tellurite resistance protein [Rubricoccaceae bacterium]
MFLSELTAEQKRALLVLARQVIAADERLAFQELERLEALYHEADLPPETPDAPDVVADLNYMFPSARARAVVVLELLMVALADASVDRRELRAVRAIAEAMEVSEADWEAMRDWAGRYAALVAEARAFGQA